MDKPPKDRTAYDALCNHIDMRHKIKYEHVDYKSTSKDDPMGLALAAAHPRHKLLLPAAAELGSSWAAAEAVANNHEVGAYELDAIAGKGRGKEDGKCHTCGGDGHVSRDCPSTLPTDLLSRK